MFFPLATNWVQENRQNRKSALPSALLETGLPVSPSSKPCSWDVSRGCIFELCLGCFTDLNDSDQAGFCAGHKQDTVPSTGVQRRHGFLSQCSLGGCKQVAPQWGPIVHFALESDSWGHIMSRGPGAQGSSRDLQQLQVGPEGWGACATSLSCGFFAARGSPDQPYCPVAPPLPASGCFPFACSLHPPCLPSCFLQTPVPLVLAPPGSRGHPWTPLLAM